jgi:hypothetical protein
MAATLIGEKVASRSSIDDGFTRTYTRVFLVSVTSKNERENTAILATGVPRVWDPYVAGGDSDTGALCRSVTAQVSSESPYLYEVTCEYSSAVKEESQQAENPLARPAKISWSFQAYEKPLQRDIGGRAIVNSAKLPFDPPVTADDRRILLTIQRNEATFNVARALEYQDSVNLDPFFGAAAGLCKTQGITGDGPHSENGTSFWSVTYSFEFRKEGWFCRILDAGYSELIDSKIVEIKNGSEKVSIPEPLDGTGRRLNRAKTTLAQDYDAAAENLDVADGTVFALEGGGVFPDKELVVQVDDEDIYIQSVAGNTLSDVVRGYNGTEAAAHSSGATVKQAPVFLTYDLYQPRLFSVLSLP